MKIAYFVNSFESINWGGQATSNGIKHLIKTHYPKANFHPLSLPNLPFKKFKIFRNISDYLLLYAIRSDNEKLFYKILKYYGYPKDFFAPYTHVCFNGEGAIHCKSGHLVILMGLLLLAKKSGLEVAAINQTVDLNTCPAKKTLVKNVYQKVDFLSVREPASLDYVHSIGLNNAQLIPDAAYGLPHLQEDEITKRQSQYNLPLEYVCIAGSSALKRNKKSLQKMEHIIRLTKEHFGLPIIFLANAKTDIWLAHALKKSHDFIIIEPPVRYLDAMAIIAKSKCVIGGRQHPMIFAYEYKVPFLPFGANTQKNSGVTRLQNYPLSPLPWDISKEEFIQSCDKIDSLNLEFHPITITHFPIFKEEGLTCKDSRKAENGN